MKSLIKFDLSCIPSCVECFDINLIVNCLFVDNTCNHNLGIDVRKITEPWDENTVTWNNAPATSTQYSSYICPCTNTGDTETINLNCLPIEDWLKNNHGFMLVSTSSNCASYEGINTNEQPRLEITYNNASQPSANAGSDQTICSGQSATIGGSPTASGGGGNYSYEWSPSIGLNSTSSANPTASPNSQTTYNLTVTDDNGCFDTDQVTVDVGSGSAAPNGVNATPSGICKGETATLNVNGGSLAQGASWEWYSGSCGGMPEGNGSSITVSPSITTTYHVRAEGGGCGNTTCASSQVQVSNITATTSSNDVSECGKSDGFVSVTPTGGISPYEIDWSNGESGQTLTGLSSGSYTAIITDNKGCTYTTSPVSVEQPNAPNVTLTNKNNDSGGCNGEATVSAYGGTQPYSYDWSNGQSSSTATGLCGDETYTVTVSDDNKCTVTTTVSILPTSIDKIEALKAFQLTPNPTTGHFQLQLATNEPVENLKMTIFNVVGEGVYQNHIGKFSGKMNRSINLSNQSPGVYILRLVTQEGEITRKVVVR
jgi:hypothetical protein